MAGVRETRLAVHVLESRDTPAGLDPTFGTAGVARLDLAANDILTAAAVQPDGKVVAVGLTDDATGTGRAVLTRLNADGTPDAAFGTADATPLPVEGVTWSTTQWEGADAVVVLPDGRIYLSAATATAVPGGDINGTPVVRSVPGVDIYRFLPDGRPDAAYGTNGRVTVPAPAGGLQAESLTVLADGSVVLAGAEVVDFTPPSVTPAADYRVPVARVTVFKLTPAGTPDAAFGTNGFTTFDPGEGQPNGVRVRGTADGRLRVTGGTTGTDAAPLGDTFSIPANHIFVAGLTAAGALDTTYGTAGVVTLAGPASLTAGGTAVAADGAVVVSATESDPDPGPGVNFGRSYLTRLTPDGTPDAAYGDNGRLTLDSPYYGEGVVTVGGIDTFSRAAPVAIATRPGGGVYAVGRPGYGLTVQAVSAAGVIDPAFGDAGIVVESFGDPRLPQSFVTSLAVAADAADRLTLAGWAGTAAATAVNDGARNDFWFARLDPAAPTAPLPAPPAPAPAFPSNPVAAFNTAFAAAVSGDVTGDGLPDTVSFAGPGGGTFTVVEGRTGRVIAAGVRPFEDTFTGGLQVAVGDLDGDGVAEIVVAPDVGGGARIQVYRVTDGKLVLADNFFAIADAGFRGGARVAVGDMDGDGRGELVVGAGPGGGPRVAVYDGRGMTRMAAAPPKLTADFFAFPGADAETLRNGVSVAATDMNADGRADLVFGAGAGGAPRVFMLDGGTVAAGRVAAAQADPIANGYFADDTLSRGGVRVTAVPAASPADRPTVRVENVQTGEVRVYTPGAVAPVPLAGAADALFAPSFGVFVG